MSGYDEQCYRSIVTDDQSPHSRRSSAIRAETLPQFDDCQVLERLQRGALTETFRALQQPLGRQVVIKALSSSILPSSPFASLLEREARLLAELDHPNVIHLYDFARRDDRMWMVVEHVDGWTLDVLIAQHAPWAAEAAAGVAYGLARALQHAHGLGIVHRDLQPRNVLVSRRGDVKLSSFAVALSERLPTAPELLDGGQPRVGLHYLSPEQVLGEPPDPRSDLFSLGVLLYELLTGVRPFDGPDDRTTTQRIRHDVPAPLAQARVTVPPRLERILRRCLEKLPSDRFGSAEELALELRAVIADSKTTPLQAIRSVLQGGPVSEAGPMSIAEGRVPQKAASSNAPLRVILGQLAFLGLMILGGAAIHYSARARGATRGSADGALELVPANPGYLRVVADPWAHVIVDGQAVDTTPFSRPIPLQAGAHYVRLEHPQAQVERRTLFIAEGETILLDIKMSLLEPRSKPPTGLPDLVEPVAPSDGSP